MDWGKLGLGVLVAADLVLGNLYIPKEKEQQPLLVAEKNTRRIEPQFINPYAFYNLIVKFDTTGISSCVPNDTAKCNSNNGNCIYYSPSENRFFLIGESQKELKIRLGGAVLKEEVDTSKIRQYKVIGNTSPMKIEKKYIQITLDDLFSNQMFMIEDSQNEQYYFFNLRDFFDKENISQNK